MRLRLRLEIVNDDDLRKHLIDDLAALQSLGTEGIELARLGCSSTEHLLCLDVQQVAHLADCRVTALRCGTAATITPLLDSTDTSLSPPNAVSDSAKALLPQPSVAALEFDTSSAVRLQQ